MHIERAGWRRDWRRLGAVAGLALGAVAGAGAQESPYGLYISQGLSRDSNVLRAPSGQGQADTISTTTLGGLLDQSIGRQRLKGEASVQANHFRQESALDNNVPTLKGEWDWQAGDHWEGELGVSHAKSLYRYSLDDGTAVTGRNIQTENQQFFRARLGVVTQWTLEAGWSGYQRSFSDDQYRNQNQSRHALNAGVRYQPQPDLSARFNLRRTDGRYPDYSAVLGADDYTRWDVETLLTLRMSAASQLDARLSHTNEAHSQPAASAGPHWTGSVGWKWQPTGKLTVSTRVLRDSDTSDQTLGEGLVNSQNKQTTRLDLGGQWAITDKVQLGVGYQQSWRRLEQAVTGGAPTLADDSDRTVSVRASYQPVRAVSLGCNVSREIRDVSGATGLSYPYSANVFGCTGRFDWR